MYEDIYSRNNLNKAYDRVKRTKTSPGVDGERFSDHDDHSKKKFLAMIQDELKTMSYKPLTVRRQVIPKPEGGERLLGIPAIRDRVVQAAILNLVEDRFEGTFHNGSYGYRKGRSCQQAIKQAQTYSRSHQWVVDMDMSKFFDMMNHKIIITTLKEQVKDEATCDLIELFLKAGVELSEGVVEPTDLGSPQGGIISPLIANSYLNRFDWYIEDTGHKLIRYADDVAIFTESEESALAARRLAEEYLTTKLELKVNTEKTHIAHCNKDGIKFLGVVITDSTIKIQRKKVHSIIESLKDCITEATQKNLTKTTWTKLTDSLNNKLRGIAEYYSEVNCYKAFKELDHWLINKLERVRGRHLKHISHASKGTNPRNVNDSKYSNHISQYQGVNPQYQETNLEYHKVQLATELKNFIPENGMIKLNQKDMRKLYFKELGIISLYKMVRGRD